MRNRIPTQVGMKRRLTDSSTRCSYAPYTSGEGRGAGGGVVSSGHAPYASGDEPQAELTDKAREAYYPRE